MPRLNYQEYREYPEKKKPNPIFHEDGWEAEVQILEDRSTEERESYVLKVVKTFRHSMIFKSKPDGEVFEVWKEKDFACTGLWYIEK